MYKTQTDTRFVFKRDKQYRSNNKRCLKPTQDLYLNLVVPCGKYVFFILKPTQDLYLNGITGLPTAMTAAQTDTRFVFKPHSRSSFTFS